MPYTWELHHCWCSTHHRKILAPHGSHHEFCPKHTDFYYHVGKWCRLCREEEERELSRSRHQAEKRAEKEKRAVADAWYKDGAKQRKRADSKAAKQKSDAGAASSSSSPRTRRDSFLSATRGAEGATDVDGPVASRNESQ